MLAFTHIGTKRFSFEEIPVRAHILTCVFLLTS